MTKTRKRYLNRELSWLEFNARVLGEALDGGNQLLERLKFVGIVSSNLDEFFMVRVAALKRTISGGKASSCPTGMSASKQLANVRKRTAILVQKQQRLLARELVPGLGRAGIELVITPAEFDLDKKRAVSDFFQSDVFPVLTPLRIDESFPFIEGLSLHLMLRLSPVSGDEDPRFALVRIPSSLPRFVSVPSGEESQLFVTIETIIEENAGRLFPGYTVSDSLLFRVTRDADIGVDEERDEDFLVAMEEILVRRQTSLPVRMEIRGGPGAELPADMLSILVERLELSENDVYALPYMLDPSSLTQFSLGIDRDDLRDPEWVPIVPECFKSDESVFHIVREADRVVHHPYESFEPVLKFLRDAASDPDVLAIKITLYRTSGGSPVVQALKEAAERGIQVTAFIELKARFDEERNITWAQELERVGVIVVHGIANLKVHAKACMIIRRERDGIGRYMHLSTGNYNDRTARLYSDIGLFTASEAIATDIAHFFNAITGYSSVAAFRHIVMAPVSLKSRLIELIRREIARKRETGVGRILVKLNSVGDPDVIEALYEASCAGVVIRMNIRGICMLIPGVAGVSEHIEVTSIVDRYLEHSRILYFENGGSPEIYLSSADWMPRNLERRIELLFPVTAPEPMARLYSVLMTCLDDNVKAHHMQSDGSFVKASPNGTEPKRAQEQLRREAFVRADNIDPSVSREFTVRRSGKR